MMDSSRTYLHFSSPEFKSPGLLLPADRTGRHAARWLARRHRIHLHIAELVASLAGLGKAVAP